MFSSVFWQDAAEQGNVFGVVIPMLENEQEWKKVPKNPQKFVAKSMQKGAEVVWERLNPTQRKAMAEAKQLIRGGSVASAESL